MSISLKQNLGRSVAASRGIREPWNVRETVPGYSSYKSAHDGFERYKYFRLLLDDTPTYSSVIIRFSLVNKQQVEC